MMTRNDYREIAEAIRTNIGTYSNTPEALASLVQDIADALKRNNPRFRYDVFFEACGLTASGTVED